MAGVAFPFSLTTTGSVKMDDGINRKKMLVISAILTRLGERADIPTAGIIGHSLIFRQQISSAVKNVLIQLITDTVENQIKGLRVNKLQFENVRSADGAQTTRINLELIDLETKTSVSAGATV